MRHNGETNPSNLKNVNRNKLLTIGTNEHCAVSFRFNGEIDVTHLLMAPVASFSNLANVSNADDSSNGSSTIAVASFGGFDMGMS